MRAIVRFRLPEGGTVELGPGDLIGRLWSAALSIPDPRISEAHAMISLRGEELKLLALRGRFAVEGRSQSGIVLAAGQRIALADGLELLVEEVTLPSAVFAIEGDGLPRVVVAGPCSLLTRPRPELVPRLIPEAPAWLWSDGEVWCLS
ncbi:MAG TPA: FHA domain-containing protein, partial [Myxococcota bacterium]|nr:FHA domain-containing protein [Myxococcota bacterium]